MVTLNEEKSTAHNAETERFFDFYVSSLIWCFRAKWMLNCSILTKQFITTA